MAAAPNKPGAVHYALIFFVMLAVGLGITTYMFYRESSDRSAENLKLSADNQTLNRVKDGYSDSLVAAKKKIGINLDQMDDVGNPNNPSTVLGALQAEMVAQGKDFVGGTVVETLRKLREALDTATADRDTKATKIASLEKEVLALKGQYQQQVDNYGSQAKASERDKLVVVGDREEKINAHIQENARLSSEINTTRDELAQEKESREKERKALNATISGLEIRVDYLKDKIDNLERLSFEVADGVIRRVEHASGTVWINLGEADFLKPRMTFSVYSKANQGVGRGAEDIKGKIEVTRILGPHMAEARVIDEDLYRPMVTDDLIYTPIWSPGLIEKISIVGFIDLDQDGRSDREQFHKMMQAAGCIIDNEVDDSGERIPPEGKITVQTRFLVRGDIPELADVITDDEKARVSKINGHLSEMQKEARANGVRVIKLNDFLAYVGYHTKRRTFLPGQSRPYSLKQGASTSVIKAGGGDQHSTGNVSQIFKKGRQDKQETSSGATSKAFGGSEK